MNKKLIVMLSAFITIAGIAAEPDFKFDFEKGFGAALPPYCKQIKDKHCGGQIEIIADKSGNLANALKLAAEPGKETRLLITHYVPAKMGDVLVFECNVKGSGVATFGIYGFDKPGNLLEYNACQTKINADTWQKTTKEVTIKKNGVVQFSPFLQANTGAVVFSGLKISIKGSAISD